MDLLRLILTLGIITSPYSNIFAKEKLDIKSDLLNYDRNKNTATFYGNVVICISNVKLVTEKVIFHFEKQSEIKKIIIPQKLKAIHGENNSVIIANEGIYIIDDELLKLKGNVIVEDPKDAIVTKEIVIEGKLKNVFLNGKESS